MKKIFVIVLLVCQLFIEVAYSMEPQINEKVMKTFRQLFSMAEHVNWNSKQNVFFAGFKLNGIQTKAAFKKNGELIYTIRYYAEEMLPTFVLYKIKSKYAKYTIHGVTEVTTNDILFYEVVLKNEKNYVYVSSDSQGNLKSMRRFKRADIQKS